MPVEEAEVTMEELMKLASGISDDTSDSEFVVIPEDRKKEKNRNSVKRSYYRKLETLDQLRKRTNDLRAQYHGIVAQWKNKEEDKSSLLYRYMELSELRDALWRENELLRLAFEEREKAAFRLQRLFDVNYQLMDHSVASRYSDNMHFHVPMVVMEEMPFEEFQRFAQYAKHQVEEFVARRQYMTKTSKVLGWTSSHTFKEDVFRWYFEKQFTAPGAVQDVARQAWETLTNPERHSKLYAAALHVRFHIMQKFDSNNYVLYRTMEKEGEDAITTALICMTRIPLGTNGSCVIICKGLKKEKVKLHMDTNTTFADTKKKVWRESMYWLSIEDEGDDEKGKHVRIAHGGRMKKMGNRSPSFWLFENLQIALRWENKLGLSSTTPIGG